MLGETLRSDETLALEVSEPPTHASFSRHFNISAEESMERQ
jgi:hypothetical protein